MIRFLHKPLYLFFLALLASALVFSALQVFKAHANFNEQINYQGKITNASGTPVTDGNYDVTFKLYTTPTGGTPVWTENWVASTTQVKVNDGLFSVMLGAHASLSDVDFNQILYLGINFNSDGEMTPRKALGSVPAAFEAKKLDGLSSDQFLRSDKAGTLAATSTGTLLTVNQTGSGDLFDVQGSGTSKFIILNNGNVGIGNANPSSLLSVGSTEQFQVDNTGAITGITGITGATGNFDLGSTTLTLPKHVIDNLNLIASSTRTGSSGKLVTGTAGANDECAKWDASGNLTSSGAPCGAGGGGAAVAGSSSQIQFNDGGALGASDQFVWDDASTSLGIGTDSPWAKLSLTGGDFVQKITGDPVQVGKYTSTGGSDMKWPFSVFVSGSYAYVAGGLSNTMVILDVSDPANPVEVGKYTSTGSSDMNGPQSVTVAGSYAYVAGGTSNTMVILDISDPANPVEVGKYTSTGSSDMNSPQSVTVAGSYAYVAGRASNTMVILDISDPANPVEVGKYTSTGSSDMSYPYSVTVAGSYAYVAGGGSNTMVILDISDPTNPVEVGKYTSTGGSDMKWPYSVTVSGSYAYVAGNYSNTMVILDISDPANPVEVGKYTSTGSSDMSYPYSVTVAGSYAYVAGRASNTMVILDISDPANPVEVGKYTSTGSSDMNYPFSVTVSGSYAYVAGYGSNTLNILKLPGTHVPTLEAGTAKISKLDVGQDAEISGSLTVNTGLSVGGSASFQNGAGVFGDLSLSGGDFVQRITSSDDIVQVGTTTTTTNTVSVIALSSSYAYVGDRTHMRVYDVSDPANPAAIATSTISNYSYAISIYGNYAYVGDDGHVHVYDMSNPTDPVEVATMTTGYVNGISLAGSYAYVADDNGILVFDISDPANPIEMTMVNLNFGSSIAVMGSYAYVGDFQYMRVYDISNPTDPTEVATTTTTGYTRTIAISDSYAYVGDDEGMHVYDISNPSSPREVATTTTGKRTNDILVSGSYAYVGDSDYMRIYDISEPGNLTEVASVAAIVGINTIALDGPYVYLGDGAYPGDGHLRVFRIPTTNVPTLSAGTAAFSHLSVSQATDLQGSLNVRSGLTSGGNLYAQAGLAVAGNTQFQGLVQIGTSTASTTIPTQSLVVGNGIICVDSGGDDCGNTQRTEGTIYAKSTNVTSVDLAEQYPTIDKNLEAGDIVMLDPKNPVFVERFSYGGTHTSEADFHTIESTHVGSSSTLTKEDLEEYREGEDQATNTTEKDTENGDNAGDFNGSTPVEPLNATTTDFHPRLLGVISTKPGFLLGGFGGEKYQKCRDDSPVGTKCADELRKVPVALSGRIPVKVTNENGDIGPGDLIAPSPMRDGVGMKASATSTQIVGTALEPYSKHATGTILVFAHLEYRDLDTTGSTLDFSGETLALSALKSVTGAWEITKSGKLAVNELHVSESATFGSAARPIGLTLFDKKTNSPYCLVVKDGSLESVSGTCDGAVSEETSTPGMGGGGDGATAGENTPEGDVDGEDDSDGSSTPEESTDRGDTGGDDVGDESGQGGDGHSGDADNGSGGNPDGLDEGGDDDQGTGVNQPDGGGSEDGKTSDDGQGTGENGDDAGEGDTGAPGSEPDVDDGGGAGDVGGNENGGKDSEGGGEPTVSNSNDGGQGQSGGGGSQDSPASKNGGASDDGDASGGASDSGDSSASGGGESGTSGSDTGDSGGGAGDSGGGTGGSGESSGGEGGAAESGD